MPAVAHIIRRRHARKMRRHKQRQRSALWMSLIAVVLVVLVIAPLAAPLGLAANLFRGDAQPPQHIKSGISFLTHKTQ